jgi:undecaprenyl-diphosphatase
MQGVAIIPGLSRSGSTIALGLLFGIRKDLAAKFSFLLSIPAITGASAVEAGDLISSFNHSEIFFTAFGVLVATVVGYLSIRFLLKPVARALGFIPFSLFSPDKPDGS